MSQQSQGDEWSGDTSTSSEYGSLDERFKIAPATTTSLRSATKRRAQEDGQELDEMFTESLVLSPEKRLRLNTSNEVNISKSHQDEDEIMALKVGRPQTRRSNSRDIDRSPRVRNVRRQSVGSPCEMVRGESALCTDSISPKLIGIQGVGRGQRSPRRRSQLTDSGSVYSRHRLGSAFSPMVAGARMKVATPSQTLRGIGRQSPLGSPLRGTLRNRNAARGGRLLLSERLRLLDANL